MKKLFFLCAFICMSMQIQAQLYIVEANDLWCHENLASPCLDHAIIIQHPDGSTSVIEISNQEIDSSVMDGYLAPSGPSVSDYRSSYLWKRLNDELNAIMSQGYEIVHILDTSGGAGWGNKIYFLSVP